MTFGHRFLLWHYLSLFLHKAHINMRSILCNTKSFWVNCGQKIPKSSLWPLVWQFHKFSPIDDIWPSFLPWHYLSLFLHKTHTNMRSILCNSKYFWVNWSMTFGHRFLPWHYLSLFLHKTHINMRNILCNSKSFWVNCVAKNPEEQFMTFSVTILQIVIDP